ncbi:MAG: hypothetical protein M1830_006383, partial [Pleopsidium flavum]
QRSLRTIQQPVPRTSSNPPRRQSFRMAFHTPRAAFPLPLRQRHLPRPHHPPTHLSPPPSLLPLSYAHWTLRSQP